MKKILTLSIVFNIALIAALVYKKYQPVIRAKYRQVTIPFYHDVKFRYNRDQVLNYLPKQASIVFVGDSHVQYFEWVEVFPGARNRGIGGDQIQGVINRIKDYPAPITVIEIGINDLALGKSPEYLRDKMRELVGKIEGQTIITSLIPAGKYIESVGKVNQYYKQVASETGAKFIDLELTISDTYYCEDFVHLNPAGYELWVDKLKKELHMK